MAPLRMILLAVLIAHSALPASSQEPIVNSSEAWSTPVELSRGRLIYTSVEVEGRSIRALIDTGGANGIELSQTLADSLGIKLEYGPNSLSRYTTAVKHVKVGKVHRFSIGGFSATDQPIEVVKGDIERISSQIRMPFDAIIGWGFLSKYYLSLDYSKKLLKFGDKPFDEGTPKLQIDFESVKGNGPVIEGQLDGQTIRFLIDTGAPRSTFDPGPDGRSAPPTRKEVTLAGQSFELVERPQNLSALKDIDAQAVLGNDFLARWVITFDPAKKTFALFSR